METEKDKNKDNRINDPNFLNRLERNDTKTDLYISQDFKKDRLFYSFKTGDDIFVITSKKEIYDIKELENEGFKVRSIPTIFSLEPKTVKKFIKSSNDAFFRAHYEEGFALKLFQRIRSYITEFVFFKDIRLPDLLSLWIMGTYVFSIFKYYPYLHISAEKRSGKTRLLEVMSEISFKAQKTINITEAVLFREVENERPTLFLDEIERLRKVDREFYGTLMRVLNSGFQNSIPVKRCIRTTNDFSPKTYSVYSPKCLVGINDLDDVVKDRTIPIKMVRKKENEKVSRFKTTNKLGEIINDIKQDCHLFGLIYASKINEFYHECDEYKCLPDFLNDREKDIYEVLFIIANFIWVETLYQEDIEVDVIKSLNELSEIFSVERTEDDADTNLTSRLVKIIAEIIENGMIQPVKISEKGAYYDRGEFCRCILMHYSEYFPYQNTVTKLVRLVRKLLDLKPADYLHEKLKKQYFFEVGCLDDLKQRFL